MRRDDIVKDLVESRCVGDEVAVDRCHPAWLAGIGVAAVDVVGGVIGGVLRCSVTAFSRLQRGAADPAGDGIGLVAIRCRTGNPSHARATLPHGGGPVRVLRLAPWRRGLGLLWRFPSVWWGLLSVGTVLALTLALPPLYLGSTASASFARQSAERCAWTVGMQASGIERLPDVAVDEPASAIAARMLGSSARATLSADAGRGHLGAAVATLQSGGAMVGLPGKDDEPTTVLYRDGGEAHVRVTSRVPGPGLLLTDRVASALRQRAGGVVRFRTLTGVSRPVRVVGTYVDLADLPVQPYWCSLDRSIHLQDAFSNNVPPPVVLATDTGTAVALGRALSSEAEVHAYLERPLLPGLRIDEGDQARAVVERALARSRSDSNDFGVALRTELPFLVTRAHAVQHALQPPITGLSAGAGLAALGLVAVAGSFWAERRRTELELLSVRGVGPGALAGKGAIECALPLLCGLAAGTALAVLGVVVLGPARAVTPHSVVVAALLGPAGWFAAIAAIVLAVRRRLRVAPHGPRRRSAVPGTVLEVACLVIALAALRRVSPLQTSSEVESLPTFGLARLVLPLLVLILVARLAARIGVVILNRLRGRGDGWRVPLLLAVQRLGAVPRVPAALLVAVAVATGTCLYATGLASSLDRTVAAKAEVFVGGDSAIELSGRQALPKVAGLERATPVLYLSRPRLESSSGPPVDVIAIDPATFARGAAWDPSYSGNSLDHLLRGLGARPDSDAVPAIAVGDVGTDATVVLDLSAPFPIPVQVVSRARAFPGMRTPPFLVVSLPVLERLYPMAGDSSTERLWVHGSLQPLVSRLRGAGLQIRSTLDVSQVSAAPSLEAVLDTLNVLRSLGLLAALLAAVGLLVYVDVRARQRRLSSVLTRRMGLAARADWLSGWLEIGGAAGTGLVVGTLTGMGLVRYVSSLLDPIPLVPPRPIVVPPLRYAGGLALATLLVTALAAAMTLRSTRPDAAVLRAE